MSSLRNRPNRQNSGGPKPRQWDSRGHKRKNSGRAGQVASHHARAGRSSQSGNSSSLSGATVARTEEKQPVAADQFLNDFEFEMMKKVMSCLNNIVWWGSERNGFEAGHVIHENVRSKLVKSMTNEYSVQNKRDVVTEMPRRMTRENAKVVLDHFVQLGQEFETVLVVRVGTTSWWSGQTFEDKEIVVNKVKFGTSSDSQQIRVPDGKRERLAYAHQLQCRTSEESTSLQMEERDALSRQLEDLQAQHRDLQTSNRVAHDDFVLQVTSLQQQLEDAKDRQSRLEQSNEDQKQRLKKMTKDLKSQQQSSQRRENQLQTNIAQLNERVAHKDAEIANFQQGESDLKAQNAQLTSSLDRERRSNDAYAHKLHQLQEEHTTLQSDFSNSKAENRRLRGNIQAYEHDSVALIAEREKTANLEAQLKEKGKQLAKLRPDSLISPFLEVNWSLNFANLKNELLDGACEVCEENMGLEEEQTLDLLWRIFIAAYEFNEDRMRQIRMLLHMDQNESMEMLFGNDMRDNYKTMVDTDGMRAVYFNQFGEELGEYAEEPRLLKYIDGCGFLCWCVVLHQPKLEFRPRSNEVSQDEPLMFDATKFSDFSGSLRPKDKAVVKYFVLPGLYREGSDVPISEEVKPAVIVQKIRKKRAVSSRAVVQAPVREAREAPTAKPRQIFLPHKTLRVIAGDFFEQNVPRARQALEENDIDVSDPSVVIKINCAVPGCSGVWADSFQEFASMSEGQFKCPTNDEHEQCPRISIWKLGAAGSVRY